MKSRSDIRKRMWISIVATILVCGWGTQHKIMAGDNAEVSSFQTFGQWIQNGDKKTYVLNQPELLQTKEEGTARKKDGALPSRYNLVELGRSTSVKDQGNYGDCWAFGAIASLESNLITTGHANSNINLSERHLAWFSYNSSNGSSDKSKYAGYDYFNSDNAYHDGGSRYLSVPGLARWYGAVDESAAPYNGSYMSGLSSSQQTASTIRMKEAVYLPEVNTMNSSGQVIMNQSAITSIKQYIVSKGAVSAGVYSSNQYKKDDSATNTSSYYCGNASAIPNHEITVVGWDDSYSRYNFNQTPSMDGAWIVKNSWGTNIVGSGYFYLSYADKTFSEATGYVAENTTYGGAHTYQNIYQYDGIGIGDNAYSTSDKMSGANIYKMRRDEVVRGVGTYTMTANSVVQLRIYTGVTSGKPMSGTLAYKKSFNVANAGYHTLEFGGGFKVPKGTKYSVIVTTSYRDNGTTRYLLPFESKSESLYTLNRVNLAYSKGQSYYEIGSLSSKKWKNSCGVTLNYTATIGNALAKVFTDNTSITKPSKVTVKSVKSSKKKTLKVKWKKASGISGYKVVIAKNKKFSKGKKTYTVKKKYTSKTIKKLKRKTKYYVKIRGYKKVSGVAVYGSYSKVKNKKVK